MPTYTRIALIETFGISGAIFCWELTTLIDIMRLGQWVEMWSMISTSRALEELARLLPSKAHRVMEDGGEEEIPLEKVGAGRIKPSERVLATTGRWRNIFPGSPG